MPEYPEVPAPETPEETVCETATTITVTVPYPTGSGYPPAPPAETPEAPYPTGPANPPAPYPTGTGAVPQPPAGTAAPTGSIPKPSAYPPVTEFPGAASSVKVGGLLAGVFVIAAFFL